MEGNLRTAMRVVFLVVLAYVLAAFGGFVQGFQVRSKDLRFAIGKSAQRKRTLRPGPVRTPAYKYANTGMIATLMATAGTDVPTVGISQQVP